MTTSLFTRETAPSRHVTKMVGDWVTHRDARTVADATVNLATPALAGAVAVMTDTPAEINVESVSRLHIRGTFTAASATAGITVLLWGNNAQPGQHSTVSTLTASASFMTDATSTIYISNVVTVDVAFATAALVMISTAPSSESVTIQVAGD